MGSAESDIDPRGLIREAYRMRLGPAECRSVFLDWALGHEAPGPETVAILLARYGGEHPDHPMTAVLREGAVAPASPPRRGRGRRVRPPSAVP